MIKIVQEFLPRVLEGPKEDRHRDFSATVDPDMEEVLLIEFEIDPGPTVGDDSCIVKDLLSEGEAPERDIEGRAGGAEGDDRHS